jgi:hypothetical protein
MNIDGRIAEYNKALQEQTNIYNQAYANIQRLQGAIAALKLLKEDEEKPVADIEVLDSKPAK